MNTARLMMICLCFLSFYSCSSSGGGDNSNIIPSNLSIEYSLVGVSADKPNGDGSGEVVFTISANDAIAYEVEFGDGDRGLYETGNISHRYTELGLNDFEVKVTAVSSTGDRISESKTLSVFKELQLFWSEEFDQDGAPNDAFWSFEIGDGCPNLCGWGNNESQYYTAEPSNVEVKDGSLFIRAKKESIDGKSHTSTRMISKGKFEFHEGVIEIRAKLPEGGGTWPAFWLLGGDIDQVGWPACGEIDIMEHVGNESGYISSALHTPSSFGNTQNYQRTSISNPYDEFHVYGLNWTSEKMEFTLDGNVFYTYNPAVKNSGTWPFDKDCFFIFNIAVGGNLGGQIDNSWDTSEMEVDYIRVYK